MAHEVDLDPNGQDDRDMERLGKAQQLKVGAALWGSRGDPEQILNKSTNVSQRNFRFYSILGFTTTLMATWESILL